MGWLIAFEGIDAAGKSTQARLLCERLRTECGEAVLTFQFGATDAGAAMRDILLDPAVGGLDERAEALLVIADKAQHVAEVVRPALNAGRHVVTDRYTASTLAYQGYGRRLAIDELTAMLDFATGGLSPDLTVLLDIDPGTAGERRLGPAADTTTPHGAGCRDDRRQTAPQLDRIESEVFGGSAGDSFADRVRRGYLKLAEEDADRWVVVDASGSVDEVALRVDAAVTERLLGERSP